MIRTLAFGVACSFAFAGASFAQERPLKPESVTKLQGIKIVAGHMTDYQNYIGSDWKREQEALKEAKIISDYYVMLDEAHAEGEPDLYLVQVFPNMAALDRYENEGAKVIFGATNSNYKKDGEGMQNRNAWRSVVNVKLLRTMRVK